MVDVENAFVLGLAAVGTTDAAEGLLVTAGPFGSVPEGGAAKISTTITARAVPVVAATRCRALIVCGERGSRRPVGQELCCHRDAFTSDTGGSKYLIESDMSGRGSVWPGSRWPTSGDRTGR